MFKDYNIDKNSPYEVGMVKEAIVILHMLGKGTYIISSHFGLCAFLEWKFNYNLRKLVMNGVDLWPEYSGNCLYPVPTGTTEQISKLINHKEIYTCGYNDDPSTIKNPNKLYNAIIDKWGNHSYGDARRRMCLWLADYMDEYLKLMLRLPA